MALFDRYAALPGRLQLAVRTWLGLGIVCLLLPASAAAMTAFVLGMLLG